MTDREEAPGFRPRMGRRHERASRGKSGSFRRAMLAAIGGMGRDARRHGALVRSSIGVLRPGPGARRVVVKVHVARQSPTGAKAAALHLRYIQRDGVEKDGSKGVLYDTAGPVRSEAFEESRTGERHQFRLIVSPEDADELGLTDYVRRLMTRVEKDLGRKLEWAAVNHHNTDHPHAHVIIRGVGRDGREVRLDRGYVSNGLRWRAQEIATEELGPRQEIDIRRAYAKEVSQERFTSLDREIERRMGDDRVQVRSKGRPGLIDESTVIARLEHLEKMRLAERLSPREWLLEPGWQQTLRDLGSRGDIIKQIHAAISGDPARYRAVRAGEPLSADESVVTGRVAGKGLSDELKGAFYAVIETPTGRAYHVPLDARAAESLRPGDIVSLATKPEPAIRPVDRLIAEVAGRHRGVYEVTSDPSPDASRAMRRMRDLERLGLAKAAGQNRWTVSPNLLEELERRHRVAPARHRLLIHKQPLSLEAQVRHPGTVWLDRIDTKSLAPYGLGAEVHRAVEKRRVALRHIGIDPEDPNRFAKLREIERKAVGKEVAARSGKSFVLESPDGFRGRVQAHAARTGVSYTVVSNGAHFVVLRTTASMRALQGKSVILAHDARGKVVARGAPDRDLER